MGATHHQASARGQERCYTLVQKLIHPTGSQEKGYEDIFEPPSRRAGTDAIDLPLFGLKDCEVCFGTPERAVAVQFAILRKCCKRSAMAGVRAAASSEKCVSRGRRRPQAVKVRRSVAIVAGRNPLKDVSTIESCSQTSHC